MDKEKRIEELERSHEAQRAQIEALTATRNRLHSVIESANVRRHLQEKITAWTMGFE